MPRDSRLGGSRRTRLNQQIRSRNPYPICPLCEHPIDRTLPRTGKPHPLSSVIDEWKPRTLGGQVDEHNCVEMMRVCNGIKGATWPVTDELRAKCKARVEQILASEHGSTLRRTW